MCMFCPKCGKQIEVTDQFCPSCGCSISNASAQDFAPTRVSAPTKNVAVALILSVIIPGLGQIYCGKVLKGILFLVISVFFLVGFSLIGLVIWIFNIYDTYKTVQTYNESIYRTGNPPW